jgi:hypothetical protein
MIRYVEFDALEFECVDGQVRTFHGCSLTGHFEFHERLKQIRNLLEAHPSELIETLYWMHSHFRLLCDQCLRLNGIDPSWINFAMLEQLLFAHEGESDPEPGLLVQLNQLPEPKRKSEGSATVPGRAEFLAALASHCGSMEEAFRLATTEPARIVLQAMEAAAFQQKSPKEQRKVDFDDWAQRLRAEMRGRKG